ncbi:ATP-binding protein [Hyphomicrobium sp.]|uniref:ATP-binding protein n=1 Tax=Hyphomicrobium sp. TaxID=82 RepID=UPI000F9926FF|nr:ATP-binding protein [Hyphomicrobium sp.]RUP07912.1 MAG: response regulator [Hyphomicrobium sp.]
MTAWPILTMDINREADVVAVRQRARRIAELIGFEKQDQTRVATAVSEIARNAFEYAKRGKVTFRLDVKRDSPQFFVIAVKDDGPGIGDTETILEGRYESRHGMGVGILGAKRLVEDFRIESKLGHGTLVELGKALPKRQKTVTKDDLAKITTTLSQERRDYEPLTILAEQNAELVHSLDEVRQRQNELGKLNQELEDTNRGVVALYGELEQKAEQLRQASELKTRFLSHMSHEFRTPLNSILALSDLLIKRADGELTSEQERQVGYIKRSAESLYEMVNDLLDIAKLEAGRVDLRLSSFSALDLFSGLRGALKPLQKEGIVQLVFDDPPADLPVLVSDEGKIAQVIRNLISNALKFTLSGEVRVKVTYDKRENRLLFAVRDTGIGIADADQVRIFEEFSQIDSPTQRLVKGTGLGLSLCRRLAEVLKGEILLTSKVDAGSTFTLSIPPAIEGANVDAGAEWLKRPVAQVILETAKDEKKPTVLVVDDDPAFRYALTQLIQSNPRPYIVSEAHDGNECLEMARKLKPDVIILDLQMPHRDGYAVLGVLTADSATCDIPVLISSSADFDTIIKERIAAAVGFLSKRDLNQHSIASALDRILGGSP